MDVGVYLKRSGTPTLPDSNLSDQAHGLGFEDFLARDDGVTWPFNLVDSEREG